VEFPQYIIYILAMQAELRLFICIASKFLLLSEPYTKNIWASFHPKNQEHRRFFKDYIIMKNMRG
jgi:hypothetical protein